MHTLPLSFALLTYSGYWRPVEWPLYSLKYWLYNAYSVFMYLLLHTFALCTIVDTLISKDLKTMMDKFSLSISVFGVCCKVTNLFLRREEIIRIVNIFSKENFIPRNDEEGIIQRKFDRQAKMLTIFCEILNESAVFFATVAKWHMSLTSWSLPLADWMPYDVSSQHAFVIALLHQTFGLIICANASVAHETLISGLFIQTCAQLDIFSYRIRNFATAVRKVQTCEVDDRRLQNGTKKILSDVIKHHLQIYKFAVNVNTVFNLMIFVQFTISSTVLCLAVYKMSSTSLLTVEFAWNFSYLCCMLMQVYLYCWFGNEVILKSVQIGDASYEMDWTLLPNHIRKSLLLIMARSSRPIKMSSGFIVTLSTESFMSIMRISYSAYNLLKNSSNK